MFREGHRNKIYDSVVTWFVSKIREQKSAICESDTPKSIAQNVIVVLERAVEEAERGSFDVSTRVLNKTHLSDIEIEAAVHVLLCVFKCNAVPQVGYLRCSFDDDDSFREFENIENRLLAKFRENDIDRCIRTAERVVRSVAKNPGENLEEKCEILYALKEHLRPIFHDSDIRATLRRVKRRLGH